MEQSVKYTLFTHLSSRLIYYALSAFKNHNNEFTHVFCSTIVISIQNPENTQKIPNWTMWVKVLAYWYALAAQCNYNILSGMEMLLWFPGAKSYQSNYIIFHLCIA